ncbi:MULTISPECIES: sensor histidine kinase [Clostridium]|uniref:sensor histidine kinase n=1 Tax=Clostridium TaxID=1485 RepID=UPI000774ADA1|nr:MULTISPECIES: HAMP domain-containing sensor histidine kinase [Clostridium]AUM95092.1 two-component sensor histidine kinase [Clostridium sporogenes]AVQ52534.1 sensor histidine kinase [Clostridium botulinum]MBO0545802.1 HAMP domain-containing histidine kinase [Clostridium botulinum]MBO0561774.1 HAMP domain-containing histidine kinase [Clostridium botulinum]MBO0569558.1 HAMP domain-containing histidine kinase [Clostridium botulinum]
MKFNFKIALYFFMIVFCCILFDLYAWFKYKNINFMMLITIFSILMIMLSIILIYVLKKYMEHILIQLSEVIESITDMNENEVFSVLNDDMLSKLQSQVIKLTNILKAQNRRIKYERDEIKSLISDISHQLKTPLSNLKLYYEILQDTSISKEEYDEFNFNMKSQIEKLSFLLESMIKMSRLESGIIKLTPNKASINNVCLIAIKQVYKKAKDKNIEIKFNCAEDIVLNIDKNWTTEAIFNIIDNAVKYTNNNGTIVVDSIKYEIFARIDIKDNGIGIDEKEINSIFKRFYRGQGSKNEEGVGIGLYLSRQIIEKQNGYIKVKSKFQKGSIFSIFIPC